MAGARALPFTLPLFHFGSDMIGLGNLRLEREKIPQPALEDFITFKH